MQHHAYYNSPLGQILITAEDYAVVSLIFADTDKAEQHLSPLLQKCQDWLDAYFAGGNPDPRKIPLKLTGTPFQQRIWTILREVPYGQSITYGEIAAQISPTMSAQAVGNAVGSNPVAIIVPCHRVLGKNGKLTGYAYGLERKQWLLDLEEIPHHK